MYIITFYDRRIAMWHLRALRLKKTIMSYNARTWIYKRQLNAKASNSYILLRRISDPKWLNCLGDNTANIVF